MPGFGAKYKIIEKIGEGSFSEVLKCEDRVSKSFFAAKVLKKMFLNQQDVLLCAEIIAMKKLSEHENVLYMHEYFFEKSCARLIFIFEFMDMSMFDFMHARKRCFPEAKVKDYLFQILNGLNYLHEHGLFHRDIKPENILVKLPNNETNKSKRVLIKLADLGSIRGINSEQPFTEYISTRWYRSPECLLTVGHYGFKMDIWATGCVFYEMLTMRPLFPGSTEIDQISRIHAVLGTPSPRIIQKFKSKSKNLTNFVKQTGTGLLPLISKFSQEAQKLLKQMLQYDPDVRSNTKRLIQNRYFALQREKEKLAKKQAPKAKPSGSKDCDGSLYTYVPRKSLLTTCHEFPSYTINNDRYMKKLNDFFSSSSSADLYAQRQVKSAVQSQLNNRPISKAKHKLAGNRLNKNEPTNRVYSPPVLRKRPGRRPVTPNVRRSKRIRTKK